jgi:hypothetical protein
MIVIATNNGKEHLVNLIFSIHQHGINEKILVVDTNSSDPEHLQYLESLKNRGIEVTTTPGRNFDTGAYLWAYQNYAAETYHFMHDSIMIKSRTFITDINALLNDYDVIPYIWFTHMGHGDINWKDFMDANKVSYNYTYGIFGPMFSCKKTTLDKLPLGELVLPKDKTQQTAFESIWPMFFESNGLRVHKGHLFDINAIYSDTYPHIMKKLPRRN